MVIKLARTAAIAAIILAWAGAACAQSELVRPSAIDDGAWLAGRWVGEGFGGELEEAWAPPAGGQMVGHFRYSRDGVPQFYELMLIDVVDGGLRLRVKHFNPDFVGWEERHGWHSVEPVPASADALVFEGLEIRRDGADRIIMRVRISRAGTVSEEFLRFERAPL